MTGGTGKGQERALAWRAPRLLHSLYRVRLLSLGRPRCQTWQLNMHTEPAGPHGDMISDSSSVPAGSLADRPYRCDPRTHLVFEQTFCEGAIFWIVHAGAHSVGPWSGVSTSVR